jgi:hypothetical protein
MRERMRERRFSPGAWHRRSCAVGFAFIGWGCVATRGPVGASDAGPDVADAEPEAEAAVTCAPPSGGNDLSFDLKCMGSCTSTTHFDFHLDASSKSYPGCAEGQYHGMGVFELPIAGHDPLTGTHSSSLELNLEPYAGAASYDVAGTPDLFTFSATLPAEAGACQISVIIPGFKPDSSVFDDAGPPSTCTFVVTKDCAAGMVHTVTGTFGCMLPNAALNTDCTIENGKFDFAGCAP